MEHDVICYTHHSDYQVEQFSDLWYDLPPGERKGQSGKCFVTLIYEGVQFYNNPPDIFSSLRASDKEHYKKVMVDPTFLNETSLYHIRGDDEGVTKFINKVVKMMIDRIEWSLTCEDDHCDFYYSTLEFISQVAKRLNKEHLLEPLKKALEDAYEKMGCNYCDSFVDGESCVLLDVF